MICGNVYVSEVDWAGRETLVAEDTKSNTVTNDSGLSRATANQLHNPATTTSNSVRINYVNIFNGPS